MTGYDMYLALREELTAEYLCEAIARALTDDELRENMEYIAQANGIDFEDDED